jgi:hypothetical protein
MWYKLLVHHRYDVYDALSDDIKEQVEAALASLTL